MTSVTRTSTPLTRRRLASISAAVTGASRSAGAIQLDGANPTRQRPVDVDAGGGVLPASPQALRPLHGGHRLSARDHRVRARELEARLVADQTAASVAADEPRHTHVVSALE